MTSRFPWGRGPAPALYCDECGRCIGKRNTHFIVDSNNLLCSGCIVPRSGGTQRLHAKYYPACPDGWHDMFDHKLSLASRAAAWFVLKRHAAEVAQ